MLSRLCGFVFYYSVFLVLRDYVGNIYWNSITSSFFEFISSLVSSYIAIKFSIKKSIMIVYIVLCISFIFSAIFYEPPT